MKLDVRRATAYEITWVIDLSSRVQAALTASGSLQHIGPLPQDMVELAVSENNCYVLESELRRLGCVFVRPAAQMPILPLKRWQLTTFPEPSWHLHSLMLEPEEQGKRLGFRFLSGVIQQIEPARGTIFLDCWAGNDKLRDFYTRAGFTFQGVFAEKDFEVAVFYYQLSS